MYDELKHRYDFASWQGSTTLPLHLLLWHYHLRGTELLDWEIRSTRVLALPQHTRFLPSMWQRAGGGHRNDALRVDTYECSSRQEAHETMIRLLGEFSAPVMQRQTDMGFGDISFGGNDLAAVLFARANLVFLVANAGRSPLAVTKFARAFDHDLITKPKCTAKPKRPPAPAAVACAISGTSSFINIDDTVPVRTRAQPPGRRETTEAQHKLFSRNCELCAEDDIIRAQPLQSGQQQVEIYTLEEAGEWQRRDISIEEVKR